MENIFASPADIDHLYVVDYEPACLNNTSVSLLQDEKEQPPSSTQCHPAAATSSILGKNFALQVVRYKARLYALNSAHLCMLKHLQKLGNFTVVPVRVVPSSLVPEAVIRRLDDANNNYRKENGSEQQCKKPNILQGTGRSNDFNPCTDNAMSTGPNEKVSLYDELEEDLADDDESVQVFEWVPDDIEDDEESTESNGDEDIILCAVCEQVFDTKRDLNAHRTKKRHYFCTTCEDIFFNPVQLQLHKAKTEHFSDDEGEEENQQMHMVHRFPASNHNPVVAAESEIESLL